MGRYSGFKKIIVSTRTLFKIETSVAAKPPHRKIILSVKIERGSVTTSGLPQPQYDLHDFQ
jgi:hypothetical protein